jgi:putative phosphoribosyl transferase
MLPGKKAVFENRRDAGKKLVEKLAAYKGAGTLVLGIPNGGLPLAMEVALGLDAELDLIISRKIPIPLRPEVGCGAVTDDGTVILNQEMMQKFGLTQEMVNEQITGVTANIRKRTLAYRGNRPLAIIANKTVILVDDGLASGFTMMAAVESVRRRRPGYIIVAVPAASEAALSQLVKYADKVVSLATSNAREFYLADFYEVWHDISEEEALRCLEEYRVRRLNPEMRNIRIPRMTNR